MKTVLSIATAAAIAVTAVAASAGGASANGWYHGGQDWHPRHNAYAYHPAPYQPAPYQSAPYQSAPYQSAPNAGAALFVGALLGFAAAELASQAASPPDDPGFAAYRHHVTWCKANFTSYDETTDSWTDFEGAPHPCVDAP